MSCRIYCEHSGLSADLRELERRGLIELVYFPYDPDSRTSKIAPAAAPSAAQWRDLNLSWKELKERGDTWNDLSGSEHLSNIVQILGAANRRDALHVDSAFKDGCRAFVSRDEGILEHRAELERLLGLHFFHPDHDASTLRAFIESECGAA